MKFQLRCLPGWNPWAVYVDHSFWTTFFFLHLFVSFFYYALTICRPVRLSLAFLAKHHLSCVYVCGCRAGAVFVDVYYVWKAQSAIIAHPCSHAACLCLYTRDGVKSVRTLMCIGLVGECCCECMRVGAGQAVWLGVYRHSMSKWYKLLSCISFFVYFTCSYVACPHFYFSLDYLML